MTERRAALVARMRVFCASNCDTNAAADVWDLGCGAGEMRCLECVGDGNWGKFAPEIVGPDCACVIAKGQVDSW